MTEVRGVPINVEKNLHEAAQWQEREARILRETSTSPSMPELAAVHQYMAWLMRLAHVKLNAQANKIKELEAKVEELQWGT